MAVPLLSPGRHHGAAAFGNTDSTLHDDMSRLSPGVNSRNSSYRGVGGSSHSMHAAGEASSMDRQRSASRISLRPSYERLSMANGSTFNASSNPDSVAAAAVPVAAIGKVNVTDPWGTAWGMDSPYDASVAYATNPNRITMRQSAYFGSGLTLASLAGPNPVYYPNSSSSSTHPSNMASTSDGTLHPQTAASPAPSSFSSISGSQASSGNLNVWSEVSSARSVNGVIPPSAPWVNDGNGHNKRRSVSFQGDLNQFASNNGGVPSPTYSSDSYNSYNVPSHQHHQQHPQPPQMPSLRARSTTHLPSLLKQHRHSTAAVPLNRRTLSTPGSEADRNAFRKSFIGGSVVNQSHQSAGLPPVPVDPKVLAKQSKKSSSSLNSRNLSAGGGLASSRASIMSSATDRTDALSTMSGVSEGGKKSKRKSWFARSPSFLAVETPSTTSTSVSSSSNMQPQRSNTRRSTESLSATSHLSSSTTNSKPPALSRAGSSFNTFNGSPPPPTPPIPDTLPLPLSSLNDKSRKSSNNSLKNRINGHPGSGASSPSASVVEVTPALSSHHATQVVNQSLGVATVGPPATPHGSRISKTQTTPSIYGTPSASPASTAHGGSQSNGNTYGAPTSSSPLSMSPMTSPTSASSKPLKPAASARPSALQLPTHEEHSMQPDSFPSPTTHSESLSRHNTEEVNTLQPSVTMSLPPTPITESGPGGPARNALAPAAVIRASPSSPPALGSLAALADPERASRHMQSPTQTPMANNSSRARISPSQLGRSSSRPTSPLNYQEHQQRGASLQAMEVSTALRSSPKGSVHAENATTSSPATSRKASNNSLRATLRQAPPSPEPSSAIVEHMPSESQDDQFLPMGPPEVYQHVNTPPAPESAGKAEYNNSAAPPHQPTLNMSLSSFAPRKAFPVSTGSSINSNMTVTPLPRKSSAQSVLPETVPLPDSPAIPQDGFAMNAHPMEGQMPLQPRGLAPQLHHVGDKSGNPKPLKPRASSPNLQSKSSSQSKATNGKPLPLTQPLPSPTSKAAGIPTSKSSRSPFNLFKRSRSKTLGGDTPSPSEVAAAHLHAPPPAMPVRNPSFPYESKMPTGSPPKQPVSSVQMTPAQTPQLSFSSSTTSTMAGSEPSDQFYADFAPDSRPSFSNHNAIAGNRDVTLKKSVPASNNSHHQHQQQQQQHTKMPPNASNSQSGHNTAKGAFSRMFGTSKRKA